jgi:hypothetical protein
VEHGEPCGSSRLVAHKGATGNKKAACNAHRGSSPLQREANPGPVVCGTCAVYNRKFVSAQDAIRPGGGLLSLATVTSERLLRSGVVKRRLIRHVASPPVYGHITGHISMKEGVFLETILET